jgi:hypothetical protein
MRQGAIPVAQNGFVSGTTSVVPEKPQKRA